LIMKSAGIAAGFQFQELNNTFILFNLRQI